MNSLRLLIAAALCQTLTIGAAGQDQFGPPVAISNNATWTWAVGSADLDGDGDQDVLATNNSTGQVLWFENTGHHFTSWPERIISNSCPNSFLVKTGDIDGDGDIDVLAGANALGQVHWYENVNSASQWTKHIISFGVPSVQGLEIVDIDLDGDMDVLAVSWAQGRVAWLEQVSPNQWIDKTISSGITRANLVDAADMDGDGDIDVLSASETLGQFYWFENDRSFGENWTSHIIASNCNFPRWIQAADINGDGHMDALTGEENGNEVAWHKNDGGSFPVFTKHTITQNAELVMEVAAEDLDLDGDLDVLAASREDDKVAWHENSGGANPTWTEHLIDANVDWASTVHAADLTGNGWPDVLSGSWGAGQVSWYANQAAPVLSIELVDSGRAKMALRNATGPMVYFLGSRHGEGPTYLPGQDLSLDLSRPIHTLSCTAPDSFGIAILSKEVPPYLQGRAVWVQCLDGDPGAMVKSNLIEWTFN